MASRVSLGGLPILIHTHISHEGVARVQLEEKSDGGELRPSSPSSPVGGCNVSVELVNRKNSMHVVAGLTCRVHQPQVPLMILNCESTCGKVWDKIICCCLGEKKHI